MDEVPGLQAALLTFDHQHALAGDDEEVLLAGLAVVQAVLTGRENLDSEAELGPLLLPFEVGVLPALLASDPRRVARVEDEPALALGDDPELGLLQLCLGNGGLSFSRSRAHLLARLRAMVTVHVVLAVAVLVVCAGAALYGFVAYRRGSAGATVAHALALAQTALIAQAAVGLLLLSDGRRAPDRLHYAYGAIALGVVLSPWFYAPTEGPKRLLWFAGTTLLAGALAVRALMTG